MQQKLSDDSQMNMLQREFAARVLANQRHLTSNLKATYDFIVCGSGTSGSVVARGLAENPPTSVFCCLRRGKTMTYLKSWKLTNGLWTWGQNGTGASKANQTLEWTTAPSLSLWSRFCAVVPASMWWSGHGDKNDWDFFASEAGDPAWNYDSVLNIYRRIEDWRGVQDPRRFLNMMMMMMMIFIVLHRSNLWCIARIIGNQYLISLGYSRPALCWWIRED